MTIEHDGGDEQDDEKIKEEIAHAQQNLHALEQRLKQLQVKLLARGTRDITDKSREALRHIAEDTAEQLRRLAEEGD